MENITMNMLCLKVPIIYSTKIAVTIQEMYQITNEHEIKYKKSNSQTHKTTINVNHLITNHLIMCKTLQNYCFYMFFHKRMFILIASFKSMLNDSIDVNFQLLSNHQKSLLFNLCKILLL